MNNDKLTTNICQLLLQCHLSVPENARKKKKTSDGKDGRKVITEKGKSDFRILQTAKVISKGWIS